MLNTNWDSWQHAYESYHEFELDPEYDLSGILKVLIKHKQQILSTLNRS